MPKKSNIELSDDLIAEVGEGPAPTDLPSDEELDDLFDLRIATCDECGAEIEDEELGCQECWPFESLDETDAEREDDDIDYDA